MNSKKIIAGVCALTVTGSAGFGDYERNPAGDMTLNVSAEVIEYEEVTEEVIGEIFTEDDTATPAVLEYAENYYGEVTITGVNGKSSDIVIPSYIDEKKVTRIGAEAFRGCDFLESVEIPSGITSIGDMAFYGCKSLENMYIPEGVTSVGAYAFENCSRLENIDIPESLINIGAQAFLGTPWIAKERVKNPLVIINRILIDGLGCTGTVEIPEYTSAIADGAFSECLGIKAVIITEGTKSIGSNAFYNCRNLISVSVPASVTEIGQYAFAGCNNLTITGNEDSYIRIYADEKNLRFRGLNSAFFEFSFNSDNEIIITGYHGASSEVYIPAIIDGYNVTEIGMGAFHNCKIMESVYIPDGVTAIAEDAFWECSNLENISVPESVKKIGPGAFSGTAWLDTQLKEKSFAIINDFLVKASCSGNVRIPSGVRVICDRAFYDSGITSVTIPEGVTDIEKNAFGFCSRLKTVELPDTLQNIGAYSFEGCGLLVGISVPKNVKSVGYGAFIDCISLEEVHINGAYTEIGEKAIGYSISSERNNDFIFIYGIIDSEAYYYANRNSILFKYTGEFLSDTVYYSTDENGVLTIAGEGKIPDYDSLEHPLGKMEDVKEVIIENGITETGDFLFFGNSSVESVQLPDSLEVIGQSSFSGCTGLKSIIIPHSVKTIELGAFQHCTALGNVLLFDGIEKLGGYVFADCQSLESVTIPDSVVTVEERPFFRCDSLKRISVSDTFEITDLPEGTEIFRRSPGEIAEFDFHPGIPVLEIARDVEGEPGETVSVGIYIKNFDGGSFDKMNISLLLDERLEYVDVKEDKKINWSSKGTSTSYYWGFTRKSMNWTLWKNNTVEGDRELFAELQLTIPEDAVPGTVYPVLFSVPSQPDDFESGKPYYLPWSIISGEPENFISTNEPEKSTECAVMCGSVKVAGTPPEELPGEENTSDILCDMDGNGVVNMSDFIHLMRYIAGAETPDNTENCDMNSDGYVDVADALFLRYYLSK